MNFDNIIELQNVSVDIPLFNRVENSLKNTLFKTLTGGNIYSSNKEVSFVRALDSINLKVQRGKKIALIGHNGSGKSTFIRLLSGIYQPSKGNLRKTVNIYPVLSRTFLVSEYLSGIDSCKAHYLLMNNSLKGFDVFIEDILDFSELGEFLYLPLSTYSDGMKARLIFSMLTYHNHECLALDEHLSTGDSSFYKKAIDRLEKFIDNAGTLFLASHSEDFLKNFCEDGLVFQKGKIIFEGKLDKALEYYEDKRSQVN